MNKWLQKSKSMSLTIFSDQQMDGGVPVSAVLLDHENK